MNPKHRRPLTNMSNNYSKINVHINWEQYAKTTAPLIPTPRFIYTRLSSVVKKIFCCEYDMYKYKVESNGLIDDGKPSVAKQNPSYGSNEG